MKFVPDFCHRLSIGKNPVQISWSETNFKPPVNLSEQWKSETNLSWTMKFVPDFCHRLSIGQVCDKIHGLRQICLGFPEHWPWSKTNLSRISSALILIVSDFSMLIIT